MSINGRNQTICTKTFSDRNIHKLRSLVENEEPEFTKEIFSLHGKNYQREPLAIGLLRTPSDKFLINDPVFISCIPLRYQEDVNLLIALIEPFDGKREDLLEKKLQYSPMWLKDLFMNDLTFNSFF